MEFVYENGNKYVSLYEVAEFLNYKRINSFISKIVGLSKTKIKEFYIESKELVLLLFNNKRENIKSLIEILLTDSQQEEIDNVIDEFNLATNNEYLWIKESKNIESNVKYMWYLISSRNIRIIDINMFNNLFSLFKIDEINALKIILQHMEYYVVEEDYD